MGLFFVLFLICNFHGQASLCLLQSDIFLFYGTNWWRQCYHHHQIHWHHHNHQIQDDQNWRDIGKWIESGQVEGWVAPEPPGGEVKGQFSNLCIAALHLQRDLPFPHLCKDLSLSPKCRQSALQTHCCQSQGVILWVLYVWIEVFVFPATICVHPTSPRALILIPCSPSLQPANLPHFDWKSQKRPNFLSSCFHCTAFAMRGNVLVCLTQMITGHPKRNPNSQLKGGVIKFCPP